MIIMLLVINVICKFPYPQFNKEQEVSLYPTVGEFYQYYLGLQQDFQLMCKMHPKVPNVQLINQCEEIYETKGNQFISMSSNNTHFGTLSNENEVIIYEWKNSMIQQVGQSVPIDSSFNCFNINLSQEFQILVDCYNNNQFFIIQLINGQSRITYSIKSSLPIQTKIQSIVNGTNAFIVYAQYFKKYSILSLFSSQFLNLSSLNNQFVDFDIPISINPKIYVISSKEIFQLQISPDFKFYYKYTFSQFGMSNFNTINVYYNLWSYSQCDQIQVSYLQNQKKMTAPLIGCENIIFQGSGLSTQFGQPIQKILQSDQFVVYQSIDTIQIQQQISKVQFQYHLKIQNNSLLYFNYDNELFSFNEVITVYKITYPFLQINFTNLEDIGYNYTFQLICQSKGQQNLIYNYSNFYLQVLPQNDTNIYVMFNQDFPQYLIVFNYKAITYFYSFSGQLLNYTQNYDEDYFNFQQITFQNVSDTIQSYQLVSFLSINDPTVIEQFLIGYGNSSLNLLSCSYKTQTQSYQFSTLSSINFSQNVSSLQAAFSIYPQMIIVGLSSNDTIYLFQYQQINKIQSITQSNYTLEEEFSDFLVTYNSIIILIQNQEIQILTFNYTNTYTLNQSSINNFFNSIQFKPIQIVVNRQLQSSFLYINNINEVIIMSIDQNSFPIPISLIKVNFAIKQINLVSQQLIISYLCNNQQNICFQVWNVQNLPKYYYVTNLSSVNFDNNIIIQSDNLFFYVTFSNYTVNVYNPQLPYHMSLYYVLKLNSSIQCSEQFYLSENYFNEKSIIISNNKLYILLGIQGVNLSYQQQNQDFNNSINYPQFIYNYSVTSALNDTAFQQTPNQSITLYSNFTVFQNLTNKSVNITPDYVIPHIKNFTYPMNLIINKQVGYCNLNNYEFNKYCSLTQFPYQSSSIPIQNYSLITSINNEYFALQNNSYIQTVNSNLTNKFNFNYLNLNLSECLQSTSYLYTLYSICQNITSQYLLNFTLNIQGDILNLTTTQLPDTFLFIYKLSSILNQIFILGHLEQSQKEQLYWLNQSNNTLQNISNKCIEFSIEQIQKNTFEDNQSQQIIIFYIYASQVNYTIMSIDDQGIKLQDSFIVNIYFCNQQSNCYKDESSLYFQILIIQIQQKGAIILVSNKKYSYIIKIIKFQLWSQNHQEGRIIRTIPNYGNTLSTITSYYQYGVLMQQFPLEDDSNQFIIGVYYLNNLLNENLLEPIMTQGSFHTTNPNYAMIVNQEYQNVTSLYIYNQSLYNYYITFPQNVTCLVYNDIINVQILCQNEFSNGTYFIRFIMPPNFRFNFGPSAYALLSINFLLLLYFYFKVKSKIRNLDYISSVLEL